jgi:hypothetical protein
VVKLKKPRKYQVKFKKSDAVLILVFGDGMKNKDTVAIKGHTSGATGVLYKELQKRSKTFEFRTSKVSIVAAFKH